MFNTFLKNKLFEHNYNYAINKAKNGFNSLDRFNKKNTLTKLDNIIQKI